MLVFEHGSIIEAPVELVFAFHEQPDALEQLTPPWQQVHVVSREGGIVTGASVEIVVPVGPFRIRWIARHTAYEKNRLFVDTQVSGPFKAWTHRHEFHEHGDRTRLVDHIEFSLRGGLVADVLGGWLAKAQLRRIFSYRHRVTGAWCERMRQRSNILMNTPPTTDRA